MTDDIELTPLEKEIENYRKFAFSKSMIQFACGMILLTSFQKTVSSISDNLIMPIANYFLDKAQGKWQDWVFEPLTGMKIGIGHLTASFLDFIIITVIIYIFYVKFMKTIDPTLDDLTIKLPMKK